MLWASARRVGFIAALAALTGGCAPARGDAARVPEAEAVADEVMLPAFGARAWLGIEMRRVAEAGPVSVRRVMRGSPAARAGVLEGDVLVAIDGVAVAAPRDVQRRTAALRPGQSVELSLRRDGAPLSLHAELAWLPSDRELARLELVGEAAPALAGLEPVGAAFPGGLDELRGEVVLVDFWASWCGPCRLMVPSLARYADRYGAEGLRVLGVADDEREAVVEAAASWAIPYAVAADPDKLTLGAYAVRILPTLVVIDRQGVVREVLVGYSPSETRELERLVTRLLAEPA